MDSESLKKILRSNSRAYTLSPIELSKIIDFLKSRNCGYKEIREFFIKNPSVLSMKFDDFKNIASSN